MSETPLERFARKRADLIAHDPLFASITGEWRPLEQRPWLVVAPGLAECPECFAVVRDDPEPTLAHAVWHQQRP